MTNKPYVEIAFELDVQDSSGHPIIIRKLYHNTISGKGTLVPDLPHQSASPKEAPMSSSHRLMDTNRPKSLRIRANAD
jgi:hypothetical protein